MKRETFHKKLQDLKTQAEKEQQISDDLDRGAQTWAWWAVIDALDAALSAMNVIERLPEK